MEAKRKSGRNKVIITEAKKVQFSLKTPLNMLTTAMAEDTFNTLPPYVRDPMVAAFARMSAIEQEVNANLRREDPIEHGFVVVDLKKEIAAILTLGSTASSLIKAHKAAVAKISKH